MWQKCWDAELELGSLQAKVASGSLVRCYGGLGG